MLPVNLIWQLYLLQLSAGSAEQLLSGAITEDAAVSDIYYAFMGLKNLGLAGRAFSIKNTMKSS